MADKMKPKMKPMTSSEQDYDKKLEESAMSEMRDRKMREKMGEAYGKAREQSLGAPEKKMKKGGKTKCMAKGGYVRAADGCAQRGKTKGRIV